MYNLTKLLLLVAIFCAPSAFAIGEYGSFYVGQGPSLPPAWSPAVAGPPTLSSCGTSPSLSSGANDIRGVITAGTGSPTACTLTFKNTFPVAPVCSIDGGTGVTPTITSVSNTTLVMGGTIGSSGVIYYICME